MSHSILSESNSFQSHNSPNQLKRNSLQFSKIANSDPSSNVGTVDNGDGTSRNIVANRPSSNFYASSNTGTQSTRSQQLSMSRYPREALKLKQSHADKVPDMIQEEILAEDMNTEMGPVESLQRLSNNKMMNTHEVI